MVNNIMAAMKTSGSTKSSQNPKSKKTVSDDKSAFNQALSNAASAAKSADSRNLDEKDYDKGNAVSKESTETVQETAEAQKVLSEGKIIGQDAFASTVQMGAEGSQAVEEMQAAWTQILAEADINPKAGKEELMSEQPGIIIQPGTAVKGLTEEEAVSVGAPAEMTTQAGKTETLKDQADFGLTDQMASMNTGTKTAGQESTQKDKADIVDVKAEIVTDRAGLSYVRAEGNDVKTVVQAEVQVTETGDVRQEYADMLKDIIARQIAGGKSELEISLTPRHLGELLVKVAYEAGETTISIICTNEKAMQAMSSRAGELGKVLETTLGDKMNVVVEQKEQSGSQLYEDGRNDSGAQAQKEELERREAEMRKRLEKEAGSVDFLQQLRLGLA